MKKIILILALITITFISCNKAKEKNSANVDSKVNYNDIFLNQKTITDFFKLNKENEVVTNQVLEFYKNRDYQFAWFNKTGMTHAVPNFYNRMQNYNADFDDATFKNPELDTLVSEIKTDKNDFKYQRKRISNLEIMLTTTFFKYSKKVYGGIEKNPKNLDWFIPRKKKNYQVLLNDLIITKDFTNTNEPVNVYYNRLKSKLKQYRFIQKNGGFAKIITSKKAINLNETDSCLVKVKQHLFQTNDLKKNDKSIIFNTDLQNAIINFQNRSGIEPSGILNSKTINELNISVDFRIKQMMVNLERLRWMPENVEKNYLLVNIPEYKLHVFENAKPIWETNVVVGKEGKQTTIFRGNISKIILNPYWNVPTSIINKEILPALKRNRNYLTKNNMEVVAGGQVINPKTINWNKYSKNIPYEIRQKPGKDNSLGKMKFLFPNSYSIYLHDTPAKDLFDRNKRDFSHGCIRVENPEKLAIYLLKNNPSWSQQSIDKVLVSSDETEIVVKPTIPVYITYFTAWVDSKGNLNFRKDIYDLDDELAKEIFVE
ncbi:MAG: L,D-transpeptidase family protein [Flavobacterium sp.]|nr:L,D-transpeptidase family protein [Flavobacterium sp.]